MPKYDIYAYPIWAPIPKKITTKDFPNPKTANTFAYECAKDVYNDCATDRIVETEESVRNNFFLNHPDSNEKAYFSYLQDIIDEQIKYFVVEAT